MRVRILIWKYESTSVHILAFFFIDTTADCWELLLFVSFPPAQELTKGEAVGNQAGWSYCNASLGLVSDLFFLIYMTQT